MLFDIDFVADRFAELAVAGLATLGICALAILIGAIAGAVLCYLRMRSTGPASTVARIIVDFLRTLPELVLLFWLYSCLPLIFGVTLSALSTGILSLSLISAANLAEIFRGGIASVPVGQKEAGHALGLSRRQILRLVVLPQSVVVMTPPLLNLACDIIKISTLLYALGIAELSYKAAILAAESYKYLEVYTIVAIIYLVVISGLSFAARRFTRRATLRAGQ